MHVNEGKIRDFPSLRESTKLQLYPNAHHHGTIEIPTVVLQYQKNNQNYKILGNTSAIMIIPNAHIHILPTKFHITII